MRRFPIELLIVALSVVMLVLGWRIYGTGEMGRFGPAVHAQKAPSELYARMLVRYLKPPVYEEEYRMSDVEGVSKFQYAIRGYNGREVTVTAPPARVYDVSFFFGRLGQDGIWQLVDKPPLPNTDAQYTVYVKQLADYQHGERTVTFTDPGYWAVKAGRQFEIDLSKGVPKDLLRIQSAQAADPRYQQIVTDFRDFGPDEFRRNVALAQARVRGSHS
ncbi:MAG: hypothetical protein JO104_04580 [Candidatus Eremiobacteraeota bacterium]|nr:hypothetical protein [Candidatus Eremiobacteraeota bacterium]